MSNELPVRRKGQPGSGGSVIPGPMLGNPKPLPNTNPPGTRPGTRGPKVSISSRNSDRPVIKSAAAGCKNSDLLW